MGLFKKKTVTKTYDKENKKPVIKASICNGEQVAGFKDIHTGKIEEVMLIKNQALAAGTPKATILTYFYPEVTVERMSSYRKKQ